MLKNWRAGIGTVITVMVMPDKEPEVEQRTEIPGRCGFGQYALSKWTDLPRNYLEYLITDECHTSEENKAKAKIELRNRDLQPGQMKLF